MKTTLKQVSLIVLGALLFLPACSKPTGSNTALQENSPLSAVGPIASEANKVETTVAASASALPTAEEAEQVLRDGMKTELEYLVDRIQWKLMGFRKTNGQLSQSNSVYKLEYEAQLEHVFDTEADKQEYLAIKKEMLNQKRGADWQVKKLWLDIMFEGKELVSGTIVFRKTQSGWEPMTPLEVISGIQGSFVASRAIFSKTYLARIDAFPESKRKKVMSDLLRIGGAKWKWAFENNKKENDTPSEEDLNTAKYLENKFPQHPPGGTYIVHAVKDPVESTTYGIYTNADFTNADALQEHRKLLRRLSNVSAELIALATPQIAIFKVALNTFEIENHSYPKGLLGLVEKPSDAQNWHGPYLKGISKDPWGHDYLFECPGQHNPSSYDLSSMGPDGRVDGGDDIVNW